MSQQEAAAVLGVTERQLRRLVSEGQLSRRELPNRAVQYYGPDVARVHEAQTVRRNGAAVVRREPKSAVGGRRRDRARGQRSHRAADAG